MFLVPPRLVTNSELLFFWLNCKNSLLFVCSQEGFVQFFGRRNNSGRSIYICLSSSPLFRGLWGVLCHFLSPFPMGHCKDPQDWLLIYFLTWGKITLEGVNYFTALGLCFAIGKLGNSFLQQKLFITSYVLGASGPSTRIMLVSKFRHGPCPFRAEISCTEGFALGDTQCRPHQLSCPSQPL